MNELNDKWISIDAAAEYLDVNKDSIRNRIKKGTAIPAHIIWEAVEVHEIRARQTGKKRKKCDGLNIC